MNKITQTLLLFLFFGLNAFAQLANWSPGSNPAYTNFPVNSSGQINGLCRISQMKFHATNANKMYAVTGEGGFFTSNDAGTSWTVKAGTENLTGNCASLCIDYTNDQIIYLGSGDANYFSNGQGIYKSLDGGTTFAATTLTNCLVIEILQDPNNSGTFVAATNKGIYKSTNNGSTWTATTSTAIQFCDLKRNSAAGSSILYAATRENSARLYRSTDFGSTWTQITSGITTSVAFITAGARIGVTPADPNVVYFEAIGGGGIIHKSTDGGLTFTVTRGEGAGTAALPYLTFYDFDNSGGNGGQGNYNNAICIDAANPAKIYLQAHNTWLSNDSGATWTQLTHWASKVHTDMHQLQQSPFDATKLFSCNDGGVWLSTDGGNNWTTKSDGLYAYEIYNNCGKSSHTDRHNITIGTQDNGRVYRNANGWFCIGGGDDTRQKEYDYLPNGGYYYEKTNSSRKAANGGASSPSGFPTSGNYWEYLAFNRTNTNLGFMWFTDNNLYRCTNLSAATPTWTSVYNAFGAPVMAMHSSIADSNRLYVITNDAKIHVSSNALSASPTFTVYTLPTSSGTLASIAAIANNANTVYISINNRVYMSTTSGSAWTNITYNLPSVNHRKILAEEYGGTQELVFVATNNAVYYKKAGQTTWTNYSTNLPGRRAPTDFSIYDDGTSQARIRYYTYGRGVWETPITNLRSLTADFSASTTTPCPAATVNFTDLSIGNVTTRTWSFPGGTPSSSTAVNPSVVYNSPGVYDVTLQVGDGTTTHTTTKTAYITTNANNLPLLESFEGVDNPPIGWKNIDNSTPGAAWVKTTTAGGFGLTASSMLFDNYSYEVPGEKDELEVKKLNLVGLTSASLSFDVAYQVYNGYSDTLAALLSTDCGANFVSIYSKSGSTLSTAGSGTNNFVPTAAQWRKETINLNTYIGNPTVIVQFQNTNGYGNKLYLDNVTFSGTATIVASAGANGSISPSGSTVVTVGNNQAYTITPNACYQIVDVLVDGISQGPITSYTFNSVTTGHTISATFSLRTYTLTASAGSNGTISSSGATVVNCGTNKTYTITPNSCYQIADVLVDGISQGAIASYTFTNVTVNHTISATFSLRTYTINASAGANGTISPNGTTNVNCGANQTYTITPNTCYQITNVSVDGLSLGAIGSYTFTNVMVSHTIVATFSPITYSITASAGSNGTISSSGATVVNCGTNKTYTITPNSCYQVADVLVDGISQGAITSYTFTNVIANHTISATFVSTTITYYADRDGDGFGDLATPLLSCTGPPTFSGNPAVTNSLDCNDFAFSATNSCATVVNLKLFIEGYYDGNNLMKAVKMNQGVGSVATYVDDIIVELRDTVAPHSVVTSTTAPLQTNGLAVCTFASGPVGFFYIVVRYNNAIQTWTADPVHVDTTAPITYDFSTAASKAYGSNMVELAPGVYGIYTGDINQDGNIDTIDYPIWESDSNNFLTGSYPSDLNGDGNVDTIDYPFLQLNSNNFITIIRP